jgi:hypothetical protein
MYSTRTPRALHILITQYVPHTTFLPKHLHSKPKRLYNDQKLLWRKFEAALTRSITSQHNAQRTSGAYNTNLRKYAFRGLYMPGPKKS